MPKLFKKFKGAYIYHAWQICANYGAHAHFGANQRDEAIGNPEQNPKLDIVEKPENRVHKLTDSNGARF